MEYVIFYTSDNIERYIRYLELEQAIEFKKWILNYYYGKDPNPRIYKLVEVKE